MFITYKGRKDRREDAENAKKNFAPFALLRELCVHEY
jgi:hypothetical protein